MSARDLLTSAQAADLLGISERTVRDQMAKGALAGHRFGSAWATTRAAVEAYRSTSLGQPGRRPKPRERSRKEKAT